MWLRNLVIVAVLVLTGVDIFAEAPVRCMPGPQTMAEVSSHVFRGTPLEVQLQRGDDMFYLRVKWRVEEPLKTRADLIAMAPTTEIWVESSCIDLEAREETAAFSQGYCPGGRYIPMRGARMQDDGTYQVAEASVVYLGNASLSPLDQKRVWSDVANVPFTQCSDGPAADLKAEVEALKSVELPSREVPAESPRKAKKKSQPSSGCSP